MSSNNIGWNHIILEGYCMRKLSTKKDKYIYEIVDLEKFKTQKIPNKEYDSNYKTPKKPKFCEDRICQVCFFKNCPHLATADLDEKEYNKIKRKINEVYK